MVNWRSVFNRLMPLMDKQGDSYFSGGRYIKKVQELDPDFPPYGEFMEERRRAIKSTTRRDYFFDILMEMPEPRRARFVSSILDEIGAANPEVSAEIRQILNGVAAVPTAVVPADAWNADRLNDYIQMIDAALVAGENDRAVMLAYTCLEGFYKAFYRAKREGEPPNEIIELAKAARAYLQENLPEYPDEVLKQITATAHVIDRARNRFSEAHFEGQAARWLATYIRDLMNTQIRLLLHFF